MNWNKHNIYIPQYEYASCNQHGERFKYKSSKKLSVATLSCKTSDAVGLTRLILLSDHLDTPVRYDFEDHTAYIKIVSQEILQAR